MNSIERDALRCVMDAVAFLLEREKETTPKAYKPLHVQMDYLQAGLEYQLRLLQEEET